MSQYFPKPNLILEVLHWKTISASLKTEVDKLDIDKLVLVLVGLSKLSDVVKNDLFKKLIMTN